VRKTTFLLGFDSVCDLALRPGVPIWSPLVSPAVDLSILGLLPGIRHLALTRAPQDVQTSRGRWVLYTVAVRSNDLEFSTA